MSYTIRPSRSTDLPHLPDIERSAGALFSLSSDPSIAVLAYDEPTSVDTHREKLRGWEAFGWGGGRGGVWVVVHHHRGETDRGEGDERRRRVGVGEERMGEVSEERMGGEDKCGDSGNGGSGGKDEVVGFVLTELLPIVRGDGRGGESRGGEGEGNVEKRRSEIEIEVNEEGRRLYILHIDEISIHADHQRRGLATRLLRAVRDGAGELSSSTPIVGSGGQSSSNSRMKVVSLSLTTFRDVPFNAPFYVKLGFREVEAEKIEELFGQEGLRIWKEEQAKFAEIGGEELKNRRCWMSCDVGNDQ